MMSCSNSLSCSDVGWGDPENASGNPGGQQKRVSLAITTHPPKVEPEFESDRDIGWRGTMDDE
ncbi:uncharacterized protein METZ01_LOCUS17967 [marine metagenome]|uniref:Uncharacterized protein n=1 Tax=marine metagenome TaxID=408172 RepID=A0A381PI37_9ZZZZ